MRIDLSQKLATTLVGTQVKGKQNVLTFYMFLPKALPGMEFLQAKALKPNLYHESIHVIIEINKRNPVSAESSEIYQQYKALIDKANGPDENVKAAREVLAGYATSDKRRIDGIEAAVQEFVAARQTDLAYHTGGRNNEIADAYASNIASKLTGFTEVGALVKESMTRAIENFYNALSPSTARVTGTINPDAVQNLNSTNPARPPVHP